MIRLSLFVFWLLLIGCGISLSTNVYLFLTYEEALWISIHQTTRGIDTALRLRDAYWELVDKCTVKELPRAH